MAGSLHTPLCQLLEIRYPIVQAPMAGPTTPELAAAVSGAGGLGMLAATRMAPEELREAVRAVRARTDRPFGVNFLLAPPEEGNRDAGAVQDVLDRFRAELGLPPGPRDPTLPPGRGEALAEVALAERVPVFSVALGAPGSGLVESAHGAGARVVAMVTTVEEAERVAAEGVDAVVAQGAEAGGHRSALDLGPDDDAPLVGTLALVPQVVDAVSVPVVAAGGIVDGRGIAAALALGAAGAQLGTRFLVAHESAAFPGWKQALIEATEADTVVTRAYTGRPARGIRNRLVEAFEPGGPRPLAWPFQSAAARDLYQAAEERGLAELYPLLAGQGLRLLRREQAAAEIVSELVAGTAAELERLGRLAG